MTDIKKKKVKNGKEKFVIYYDADLFGFFVCVLFLLS